LGHSVSLRCRVMYRKRASGCERVHMFEQSPPPSPGLARQPSITVIAGIPPFR
jgi:hypothetical protein